MLDGSKGRSALPVGIAPEHGGCNRRAEGNGDCAAFACGDAPYTRTERFCGGIFPKRRCAFSAARGGEHSAAFLHDIGDVPGISALASSCLFILWKSVSALLTEPLIQAFLDLVPDVPREDPARRVPDADPGHVWKRNIGGTGRLPATGTEKV